MNKKVQIAVIIFSVLVFGCGLSLWLQARLYQPQTPEPIPYRHAAIDQKLPGIQPEGYQNLWNGTLFFGEIAAPVVSAVKPVFQTKVVLWGITGGKNSRAVVGLDPKSNAQTMIVKPGDMIGGETVTAIGKDFIMVRNETGTGRVGL